MCCELNGSWSNVIDGHLMFKLVHSSFLVLVRYDAYVPMWLTPKMVDKWQMVESTLVSKFDVAKLPPPIGGQFHRRFALWLIGGRTLWSWFLYLVRLVLGYSFMVLVRTLGDP